MTDPFWTNTSTVSAEQNDNYKQLAETFDSTFTAVVGNAVTKAQFNLKKVGSPTGTAQGVIWDSTAAPNEVALSIETVDVSTIPTSFTTYNFNFASTTIGTDYKIGIKFSFKNVGTDYVQMQNGDVISGTIAQSSDPGDWATLNTRVFTMSLYGGASGSSSTLLPPPPIELVRF